MARTKSVVTRARKRSSAAAQSKQIQTLARSVDKLKQRNKQQASNVMTITRCEEVPLHRAEPSDLPNTNLARAKDLAWVMPIPYAPEWVDSATLPIAQSLASWTNNNPLLAPATQFPSLVNSAAKQPVFGYNFQDKEIRGVTHKGGTLSIRVTNTFKSPTALHFFLVRPQKEFADSLLQDIGYLTDFVGRTEQKPWLLRGSEMALREGVDYTYGAARSSIPNPTPQPGGGGDPQTPAKNIPDLAMMSTRNWDILSYRRCFFDAGSSANLNTQPISLNSSADSVDNLIYKNIRMKVPAAGFIRRSMTTGSLTGALGTLDNMKITDQQNEKSVFLVCLRTLQRGGATTTSNANEYCTANISLMDKYKVSH